MPDMDGFEVAECIEAERIAEPNEDEIPAQSFTLMMLTSENQSEDIARCQELAIAGYLIKLVGRTGCFRQYAVD